MTYATLIIEQLLALLALCRRRGSAELLLVHGTASASLHGPSERVAAGVADAISSGTYCVRVTTGTRVLCKRGGYVRVERGDSMSVATFVRGNRSALKRKVRQDLDQTSLWPVYLQLK